VTIRGIHSTRKVPRGTYEKCSISDSGNQDGISLRDLTCTLGDCCVRIIVIVDYFFIDDLIYSLRKILTSFLLVIRDLFSFSYLAGTLIVCSISH
jgi:hypothetical protein